MELVLIRHAEPVRVAPGEVEGAADPVLHERGVAQAAALGAALADEPLTALYTSPMRRAAQTADALARVHGLVPIVEDRVAEFDRHAGHYIPVEEMRATKDPTLASWADGDFGDHSADPDEFRARVAAGVDDIVAANPGGTVAVVCHGGVVNAYLAHRLGIERLMSFDVAYTGITRLAISRSGVSTVLCVNDFAHVRTGGLLVL